MISAIPARTRPALSNNGQVSLRLDADLHRRLLGLCRRQITLADLAADIALPLGVVRVLLADLTQLGAITVVRQRPPDQQTGNDVLQEILNGLRAL